MPTNEREIVQGQLSGKPTCPHCRVENDAFSGLGGKSPKDGDVSICVYCQELGVFVVPKGGDPSIRKTTEEETAQVKADPMYSILMAVAVRAKAAVKGKRH